VLTERADRSARFFDHLRDVDQQRVIAMRRDLLGEVSRPVEFLVTVRMISSWPSLVMQTRVAGS